MSNALVIFTHDQDGRPLQLLLRKDGDLVTVDTRPDGLAAWQPDREAVVGLAP